MAQGSIPAPTQTAAPPQAARRGAAALKPLAIFLLIGTTGLAAPALMVLGLLPPPPVAVVWDAANLLGYAALGALGLLFSFPARPSAFPRLDPVFFLRLHRALAYATVAILVLHALPLLVAEPLVLEDLKLSGPLHMLAGLGALLAVVVAVATAVAPVRRRLWTTRGAFRVFHSALSFVGLGLAGWHVLGSGYYADTGVKRWVLAAVLGAAAALVVRSWLPAAGATRSAARFTLTEPRTATRVLILALLLATAVMAAWMFGVWMPGAPRAD